MINWRVYGDRTVAYLMDQEELPGLFSKEFLVGPGEAAVIIRDARVENVYTECRVKTAALMDRVLKFFRAESKVKALFLATTPFDFSFYIQGMAADRETVIGECKISLKVDPQKAWSILGLMAGKNVLAIDDVYQKIKHEIISKGLAALISREQSQDLLSSTETSSFVEKDVESQMRTTLENLGFVFDSFSIDWCLTEQMNIEVAEKSAQIEEESKDFENKRRLMDMERELQISRSRIQNLQEIKMLEAKGNTELKDFYLEAELGRDRMKDSARIDAAEIDARIQLIQADANHKEGLIRIEARKADEMARLDIEDREWKQKQAAKTAARKDEDDEMWEMVKMQIEMATSKHERLMAQRRKEIQAEANRQMVQIDADYQQRRTKLEESMARMDMQERLIAQAINTGAADAGVLKTMLEEATKQDYASINDEKVKVVFEADVAKNMIQGAKQSPALQDTGSNNCTSCGFTLQAGWKVCPACGNKLPEEGKCLSCGKVIDPVWKACPECGAKTNGAGNDKLDGNQSIVDSKQKVNIQDSVIKGDIHLSDTRDFSKHITNVTDNSTTKIGQQYVGSTVNINQAPSSEEMAKSLLTKGLDSLIQGGSATNSFREVCKLNPGSTKANLALGIAILLENKIAKLSHRQVQEVERALNRAISDPSMAYTAAYALGALRHCFYIDHSMKQPEPDFKKLKEIACNSSPPNSEFKSLIDKLQVCDDFKIDWML